MPTCRSEIKLSRGYVAIVDADDFDRLSKIKWYAHGKKRIYARSITHGFLHHHILPPKEGWLPDHIDNNSLNNSKANLRYATASQNKLNGGPYSFDGKTSQFRGVTKRKSGWMARITINKKSKSLGIFRTEHEAAQAYEARRGEVIAS
jgi:hypothetical protein